MELEEGTIRACAVGALEDLDAFVIALYDNPEEPEWGLELQRSLEEDEQDAELGLDTYCLMNSSGATFYGGLSSCVLRQGELTLRLSPKAAEVLGASGFRLQLELDEAEREALRGGLTFVFDGHEPPELILG